MCQWNFKPMVELTLRHLLALAAGPQISTGERRLEIAAALDLAGF